MKELSSLDLKFLAHEFQVLINAKVEQIYQSREEFIIQFHIPNKGKTYLRLIAGTLVYMARAKGVMPERPPSFCLYMRRQLKNARLRIVEQLGFERVLHLVFETKDKRFNLYFEILSKGNIVLCNEENIVLSATSYQEWKDRSIKRGKSYTPPSRDVDITTDYVASLAQTLKGSDKESVVKSLAIDFGLGGKYSEELCTRAGIDKSIKPGSLSEKEVLDLVGHVKGFINSDPSPRVILKHDSPVDIVPVPLSVYKDELSKDFDSFNNALDSVYTAQIHEAQITQTKKVSDSRLSRVQVIINEQEQRIRGLEKAEKENQKKGEVIYENYPKVKEILDEINNQKKEHSLKEIAVILKKNKVIKSLDEATGDVVIEL